MNWFYLAIAVSFSFGAFAYVLFAFWLRPILAYRRLKRQVTRDIVLFSETLNAGKTNSKNAAVALRKNAKLLSDPAQLGLPEWYKLLLTRREESPDEAGRLLAALANTRDPDHATRTIKKILQNLNG
jgi:hypothetical protein